MGKTVNFLGWVFVVITILALVATLSTSHQVYNVEYHFMNYKVLQWCIFFTMSFWSVHFFSDRNEKKSGNKVIYSLICLLFAIGSMFFIFIGVK